MNQPRWYIDADVLGLAKVLIRARPDVTYPGDKGDRHIEKWRLPSCVVTARATPDEVWIPAVAQAGMSIITRDLRISKRVNEVQAVKAAGARMFAIASTDALTVWGQVEVVVTRWRDMEAAAGTPGPFIYRLTRTAMSRIL